MTEGFGIEIAFLTDNGVKKGLFGVVTGHSNDGVGDLQHWRSVAIGFAAGPDGKILPPDFIGQPCCQNLPGRLVGMSDQGIHKRADMFPGAHLAQDTNRADALVTPEGGKFGGCRLYIRRPQ